MKDTRPVVSIDRNNAGTMFIGLDEFDKDGICYRSAVLCMAREGTADVVMERRYQDMRRLMGDNIRPEGEWIE